MQKRIIFIVCFFICAGVSAQQYPFVHYTPKDGLISNRVRNIYQDSRGRIYFSTMNGLSVYDGARFTNYTVEDGLHQDVVNGVMEMGDDSLWVFTNISKMNCLVKGRLKTLVLKDSIAPLINFLCRSAAGQLYAAADDGLFLFDKNSFVKLPLTDIRGEDINSFITTLVPYGDYLLVMRDYVLVTDAPKLLYLYDCKQRKIVSQTSNSIMFSIGKSASGLVWVNTDKGLWQLDTAALRKGKIIQQPLPAVYKNFAGNPGSIFFDNNNDCWLTDGAQLLKRCDTNGNITVYTTASGLNTLAISYVFQDMEGTIWLASNGGGVEKLMQTNLSFIEKPFGLSSLSHIIQAEAGGGMLFYSSKDKKIVRFAGNSNPEIINTHRAEKFGLLAATPGSLYGIRSKEILRLKQQGATAYAELLYADTSENYFNYPVADKNGNLILGGSLCLTAVAGSYISQVPINYLADQIAADKAGNIWAATRTGQLFQFSAHPENPAAYLKQERMIEKEIRGIQPRSITVDNTGKIWIGTRFNGLYVFQQKKEGLQLLFQLSSKTGLTENFISYLSCDDENNIWACSPSGLDKIRLKNNGPVIENITRQNNMYQFVNMAETDNSKTTWALSSGGLFKITSGKNIVSGYMPRLMITQVRTGATELSHSSGVSLSYKQNNLSFYFAAPSFLDEKQILFSYRLQGSSNAEWSEPTNIASASFIDLRPGNYTLNVKAKFPAGRYPEQTLHYKFSIAPPWWQTWWFRLAIGILGAGVLITAVRSYYRRKLEKEKAILEKQQAVEKERSRIATDMHDDLGAGLSKIRFLSETVQRNISEEAHQPYLQNISSSSVELVDKFNEIIWAMNEKNNTLEDMLYYIRNYAAKYCEENNLQYRIFIPDQIPAIMINGEMRRHIFLTVKESLHNVVKHAEAKKVILTVQLDNNINITIHDDGKGFNINELKAAGNGLRSMEQRISSVNGRLVIENKEGTNLHITVPIPVS